MNPSIRRLLTLSVVLATLLMAGPSELGANSPTSGGAGYDHPSDLFEPPADPPDGGADSGGGSEPGKPGDSKDSDDAGGSGPVDSDRQAATDALIARLEAAVQTCNEEEAESAAARAATMYSQGGAGEPGDIANAYRQGRLGVQAAIDGAYAAASAATTVRERELTRMSRSVTARPVGDPIRLSDGAFLFTVPLPTIRHWGLKLDLSLHYQDITTASGSTGGRWTWVLGERVIPGVPILPGIRPLLDSYRDGTTGMSAALDAWRQSLGGRVPTAAERAATRGVWETLAQQLQEIEEEAETLLASGSSARLRTLRDGAATERARVDSLLMMLGSLDTAAQAYHRARDEESEARRWWEAETARFAAESLRHDRLLERQNTCRPDTVRVDRLPHDPQAAILLEADGTLVSYTPDGQGSARSRLRPWQRLSITDDGFRLTGPRVERVYDRQGRLEAVRDDSGHALRVIRGAGAFDLRVEDESGRVRVRVSPTGDGRIGIDVPGLEPVFIDLPPDGSLRPLRISGPRGWLEHTYDAHGCLTRVERRDGSTTRITRSTGHTGERRIRVAHSDGSGENLVLGQDGLRTYRDADGVAVRYRLDDGRVVSVQHPSGKREEFTYDAAGQLLRIRDNHGRDTRIERDRHGAIARVLHADGSWVHLRRDARGRVVERRNDRGLVVERVYDSHGRLLREAGSATGNRSVRWHSDRELSISVDGTETERLTLDSSGNIIRERRSDGRELLRTWSDAGQPLRETIDGEEVRSWTWDGAGRLLTRRDGLGLLELRRPDDHSLERYRNGRFLDRERRDSRGRVVEQETFRGDRSTYRYTAAGRLAAIGNGNAPEDGNAIIERREYGPHGLLTVVERDGQRRVIDYDSRGRLQRELIDGSVLRRALHGPGGRHDGWEYADGSRQLQRYHAGGRLEVESPGYPPLVLRVGPTGKPLQVVHPWRGTLTIEEQTGERILRRDGELHRRERRDAYGRLISVEFPDGSFERWDYREHGRVVEHVDRRGGRHIVRRDHAGRLQELGLPDGSRRQFSYTDTHIIETTGTSHRRILLDPAVRVAGVQTEHESWRDRWTEHGLARKLYTSERDSEHDSEQALRRMLIDPDGGILAATDAAGVTFLRNGSDVALPRTTILNGTRLVMTGAPTTGPDTRGRTFEARVGNRTWTGILSAAGIRRLVLPGGTEVRLDYHEPGLPALLSEQSRPGGPYGWRIRMTETGFVRSSLTGETRATYAWDPDTRTLQVEGGALERVVHPGPYGLPRLETLRADAEDLEILNEYQRDPAGRPTAARTRVTRESERHEQSISADYGPDGRSARLSAGGLTMDLRSGGGETVIDVSADLRAGLPRTRIELSRGRVRVADVLELRERALPGHDAWVTTISQRVADGPLRARDALLTLLGESGEETAEYRLDGSLRMPVYEPNGWLTRVPDSVGPRLPVPESLARRLAGAWTATGLSTERPPGSLPTSAGSRSAPTAVWPPPGTERRDSSGRITAIDGWRIAYDETNGAASELGPSGDGNGERTWRLLRSLDSDILFAHDATEDVGYIATTLKLPQQLAGMSIRLWRRTTGAQSAAADRYRRLPRGSGAPADPGPDSAIEILKDGRLIAILTPREVLIPFHDRRETLLGVAGYRRTDGSITYSRTPALPAAIPWQTRRVGYLQFPGQTGLWSPSRLLLPSRGVFTSRDPALYGFDWYGYALGDPVNLRDPGGHYVVPVGERLADVQQDDAWGETRLGEHESLTIGVAGCLLTTVSNVINAVSGSRVSNPRSLNRRLNQSDFFIDEALLSAERNREIIEATTGRHVEQVSFDPATVDMERVAAYLNNHEAAAFLPTARLRVYRPDKPDSSPYLHFLNVNSLDASGAPRFRDTSTRGRTGLGTHEVLTRYDVYVTTPCRSY